ncbi:unnamed protein product [Withania somnifera]
MGSDVLFLSSPAHICPLSSPLRRRFPLNISTLNSTRCLSTSSGDRGHSNSRRPKDYQGFSWHEEIKPTDRGKEFGFGQRIWWSDDYDVEDEELAGTDGFGITEGSIGFAWVTKVLRAFGWMLPAIIMSAVLGTGPRSKYKKKKRNYARAVSNPGIRMGKGENTRNGKGVRDYQSSNGASDGKKSQSTLNFGGWDELDNHGMEGQQKKPLNRKLTEPKQWTDGKLSKRIGRRETPFLFRLLIAVFPFLGSWTKLL